MLKVRKLKSLTDKGFSHIEAIITVVTVVILVGIGVWVFKHNDASHASGYDYQFVGKSVQASALSTANTSLLNQQLASDQSTLASANTILASIEGQISADQLSIANANTALVNARNIYDASKAPRNPSGVNDAQTNVNVANARLNATVSTETTDKAAQVAATNKVNSDEAQISATSAGYTNSVFYAYACTNPGATTSTDTINVALVAPTYPTAMQNGLYSVQPAVLFNGTQAQGVTSTWYYGSNLGVQSAPSGPWTVYSVANVPTNSSIAFGPLPTTNSSAAWTNPVTVSSIGSCGGSTGVVVTVPVTGGSKTGGSSTVANKPVTGGSKTGGSSTNSSSGKKKTISYVSNVSNVSTISYPSSPSYVSLNQAPAAKSFIDRVKSFFSFL
ncbi:MAG TPA: hypothetical protein VMQ58_03320 [Candidatus Saccharimonadales bacterium]|jgi:hypothetical protein|nr:hypothetical protein [Candidatus Saccharimonadales bacterium]